MIKTDEMLGKKCILTIFCAILCAPCVLSARSTWQSVEFRDVYDADSLVFREFKRFDLVGLTGFDPHFPTWDERCLDQQIRLEVEYLMDNYPVKVKVIEPGKGYVRFKKEDLGLFLLRQGYAVIDGSKHSQSKVYKEAETEAQKAHRGRWGSCDPHLPIIKWQKARGRTPWFWDRYHTYLKGPSMGRVAKVLAGNLIELDNGLRVKLYDVEVPEDNDKRQAHQCFAVQSQKHLESLILGRTVSIRHDDNFLPSYKTITKQVYLPQSRWQNTIWLNHHMINSGYGKLVPESENEALISAQSAIWENPSGAWKECLQAHLTEPPPQEEPEVVEPVLEFDPECPIKGNVSGSKKNPKKTYHTPLSSWYKRIQYEQCFNTEKEAVEAGFKKVK